MKNIFVLLLGVFAVSAIACTKEKVNDPPSYSILSPQEKADQILLRIDSASRAFGDGIEQNAILTEEQFLEICAVEDMFLDIWTDSDLRYVLPVGTANILPYEVKLRYLQESIPDNLRITANEGSTVETFLVRSNGPARFDATPDIVAQVLAASGTTVGRFSSLNLWRPTVPFDTGTVTAFDITRAMAGVNQSGSFDFAAEYIPESVVWLYAFSGGNWTIEADIIVYNGAMIADTIHYGMDSPFGELIWNPTLDSPAQDDVIQGPLPGGILSISANGLTPPFSV